MYVPLTLYVHHELSLVCLVSELMPFKKRDNTFNKNQGSRAFL